MKKVLAGLAKFVFALFGFAIIGLLMTLTWGALGILFPNSFTNQLWGMVLFDIAAIAWALAFVFLCRSTGQYVAAAAGFLVGFAGTILMAAADVILSGQTFVNGSDIGRYMVYGFIGATVLHAALVYIYHASAPEIHSQIEMGIAEGEIQTQAIKNATANLEHNRPEYARQIQGRIIQDSLRNLDIPIAVDPEIGFVQVPPPEVKASAANPGKSSPWRFWERNKKPVITNEVTVKQEKLQEQAGEPISDEYKKMYAPGTIFKDGTSLPLGFTCLNCGTDNHVGATKCSRCSLTPDEAARISAKRNVQTNKKQEDADPGDAPFPGADSE